MPKMRRLEVKEKGRLSIGRLIHVVLVDKEEKIFNNHKWRRLNDASFSGDS